VKTFHLIAGISAANRTRSSSMSFCIPCIYTLIQTVHLEAQTHTAENKVFFLSCQLSIYIKFTL